MGKGAAATPELKYNGMYGAEYKKNFWPRWVDRDNEETLAPIVRTPDDILVFVAGAKGGIRSSFPAGAPAR